MISIEGNSNEAQKELNAIAARAGNNKKILGIMVEETIKDVAESFQNETDKKGKRWKEKKKPNGKKILENKGDLGKDAINPSNYHIKNDEIEIITTVSAESKDGENYLYGMAHNWGDGQDKRQFIGESEKLNKNIENRVCDWIGYGKS